jgi:molecular chaperone GrpE
MTWKQYENPSDPTSDEKTPEVEPSTSEAITPSPDPQAQIQAELAEARIESEQWRDRFLRKAAEFDNYRKRMEKEKAESTMLAKSTVLQEVLPVADACERALLSLRDESESKGSLEQYREGVGLLYRQILDVLLRMGVVPIEAVGKKFDPHLHEALAREEDLDHDENTVIQELRRGYLFRDRLLRPAQVTVAIHPRSEN